MTTTFSIEVVDLAPVMTFISVGSALQPKPTIRRTYDSFFAKEKVWSVAQGWDSSLFAKHSLRRGGDTDLLQDGVTEKLIQRNSLWASVTAFEFNVALMQRFAAFRAARSSTLVP